jgi:hypothetical protein
VSAQCPTHQLEATGTCSRCGTFVCADCGAISLCASCSAQPLTLDGAVGLVDPKAHGARQRANTSLGGSILAVLFNGYFLKDSATQFALLVVALACLYCGVSALRRRPRGATNVLAPAITGIIVSILLVLFAASLLAGFLVVAPKQ